MMMKQTLKIPLPILSLLIRSELITGTPARSMFVLPGAVFLYQGEELGLPEVLDIPVERLQDPIWKMSGNKETWSRWLSNSSPLESDGGWSFRLLI